MDWKVGESTGADPGFQVRGGALKKNAPSGGRCENFGVFRVKNHDFTPKNHFFAPPPPPGSAPDQASEVNWKVGEASEADR